MQRERRGWNVVDWGSGYGFRRTKSYQLIKDGLGPATIEVNGQKIITIEADDAWRRKLAWQLEPAS